MFLFLQKRVSFFIALFLVGFLFSTAQPVLAADALFVDATAGIDAWAGGPNDCLQTIWVGIQAPPCRTLAHAISQASNGDTIHAVGTFNEHTLIINKNITIDGGRVDANGNGKHFEIGSGKNVTLQNMFLVNGESSVGGSIFNAGFLTIDNVEFFDNIADQGGAIYNDIEGFMTITFSNFYDSKALTQEGGAIFNEGDASIRSAIFVDSEAKTFGGTLFNTEYGDTSFAESYIYRSTAENGGAIYNMMGEVSFLSGGIYDSVALVSGGGIMNVQGDLFLERSTIQTNTAGHDGGGVFNTTDGDDNVIFYQMDFNSNTAENFGGAVYNFSANSEFGFYGSSFVGNHAERWGGALYLMGNSDVKIGSFGDDTTLFSSNTAVFYGGAIYNELSLTIEETTIKNGSAWEGGAVYNSNDGNLAIDRSALLDNVGNFRGGAIFNNSTGDFITVNSTYSGNDALSFGGAIYHEGAVARVANVTMYGNISLNGGGIFTESNVQMHNSIITASSVSDCGVAGAGAFSGQRNLVDDFAAGPCSSISPNAISQIDPVRTGTPAVHTINGLSNAYNNGHSNCPDPLNGFAPLL
ncbi:MAG: hypothetical protein AAF490_12160, partial [Chloroflexota bacterium]